MNKETQAIIENISRMIDGYRSLDTPYEYRLMIETIEKYLISLRGLRDWKRQVILKDTPKS